MIEKIESGVLCAIATRVIQAYILDKPPYINPVDSCYCLVTG